MRQRLIFVIVTTLVVISVIACIKKSKTLLNVAILASIILSVTILVVISKHSPRLLSFGFLKSPPLPSGSNDAIMKVRVDNSHVLFIKRTGTRIWTQVNPESATIGGLTDWSTETEYDFYLIVMDCLLEMLFELIAIMLGRRIIQLGYFFIFNSYKIVLMELFQILSNDSTVFLDEGLTTSAVLDFRWIRSLES